MTTICLPTPDAIDLIGELPSEVEVLIWDGQGEPPDGIERVEMFVARYDIGPPPAGALSAMPELRVIQLLAAGVESWLPILPEGVILCNGRGVHGSSTAEMALAGLLAVLRHIPELHDNQRLHQWRRIEGDGLSGKRVLVIGAGDIGARIAAAVRPFDASATLVARTAREGVHAVSDLPGLLPGHQVVVIAVPRTAQTRAMVDARFLAAMPDGAVLVNIARGKIVDTNALLAEVSTGRLRAFLDVTDPEPLPPEHPLWDVPGVLLSPHVGGGADGWAQRAYDLVRDQLLRFVKGEPLHNVAGPAY